MSREQLLLLGCSTRCEPSVLHPQPQIHPSKDKSPRRAALTAPSKAGAGKRREKSAVPPKSAIKQLLSTWSCAGLHSHPVQSQKLLFGLKASLLLPLHQLVSHHPPLLLHLASPRHSTSNRHNSESSEMHLINPEKSQREAFSFLFY